MPDKPLSCDACGIVRESPEQQWFSLHLGVNDLRLLAVASQDMFRRTGLKQACSRECLHKLIDDWAEVWRPKRKGAVA